MENQNQSRGGSEGVAFEVEKDIESALNEAMHAGKCGVEEPQPLVERVRAAYESACEFFADRLDSVNSEIAMKERQLTDQHHSLDALSEQILSKWNQEKRWVKDRAEAKAAIEKYESVTNAGFDLWTGISVVLFLLEGVFGYWMFKTFVLPDNGVGEHLTSAVVGLMILAIGVFLKTIPDSTRSEAAYGRWKLFLGFGAALSGIAFIVLLAYFRQVTETFSVQGLLSDAAPAAGRAGEAKLVDFCFQLSLLLTLIFSSAFFGHWKRRVPKGLLQARRDDADDLLCWYRSDDYRYEQRKAKLDDLRDSVEDLRRERELLQQKANHYNTRKVPGLMRQAALKFIQGTSVEPHTDAKKRGGDRGRLYLEKIAANPGRTA